MLSCVSVESEWDGEGIAWYIPEDFSTLKTKARKRCKSCKKQIELNQTCLRFDRVRMPRTEMEIKIFGDGNEIKIAPHFFCESCGEIFLNLTEAGYCLHTEDNMVEALKEYQEISNFNVKKGK